MTVNLLFTCDGKYLKHAAICAFSVKDSLSSDAELRAYLMYSEIKKRTIWAYRLLFRINGIILLPIEMKIHDTVKNFPLNNHFTEHAYYRLFAPAVINEQRLIYLDPDIIALGDITELWEYDLAGSCCAAVSEKMDASYKTKIGLSPSDPYLNSGVLLMDVDRLRARHDELVSWVIENSDKVSWADQDTLNAVLKDDWIELDGKWNRKSNENEIPIENTILLHYAGSSKPWHVNNKGENREIYQKRMQKHFPVSFYWVKFYEFLQAFLRSAKAAFFNK
jgi:lipopolysaccharide biosynthesis glycosyltransferase